MNAVWCLPPQLKYRTFSFCPPWIIYNYFRLCWDYARSGTIRLWHVYFPHSSPKLLYQLTFSHQQCLRLLLLHIFIKIDKCYFLTRKCDCLQQRALVTIKWLNLHAVMEQSRGPSPFSDSPTPKYLILVLVFFSSQIFFLHFASIHPFLLGFKICCREGIKILKNVIFYRKENVENIV